MNSVEHTYEYIRDEALYVSLAGERAPVRNGMLDRASRRLSELNRYNYAWLVDLPADRSVRRGDPTTDFRDIFQNRDGLFASTGYVASIDLLSTDISSVRLFSASGLIEPYNPIQLAVDLHGETDFCIAGLAFVKTLRQMAYINRPKKMRDTNPVRWAESYGRVPFTLGWHVSEQRVLLGAAGFTPSTELIDRLDQYPSISASLSRGRDDYPEFVGAGLADQLAINNVVSLGMAVELAKAMVVQRANLNL